ncbi:hypothetical protein GCM10023160_11710 [Brachybacterium paraconglomeratum]
MQCPSLKSSLTEHRHLDLLDLATLGVLFEVDRVDVVPLRRGLRVPTGDRRVDLGDQAVAVHARSSGRQWGDSSAWDQQAKVPSRAGPNGHFQ